MRDNSVTLPPFSLSVIPHAGCTYLHSAFRGHCCRTQTGNPVYTYIYTRTHCTTHTRKHTCLWCAPVEKSDLRDPRCTLDHPLLHFSAPMGAFPGIYLRPFRGWNELECTPGSVDEKCAMGLHLHQSMLWGTIGMCRLLVQI